MMILYPGVGVSVGVEVELFSPGCQCYKLNYVLLRTKTGSQTISQNYNLGQNRTQHYTSLNLQWRFRKGRNAKLELELGLTSLFYTTTTALL